MSPQPERPSARAVERLAAGVGEDVADLRTQLHRALDEAERLQATGRDDLAVSVLQEQRDALLVVHQRLEARLADAAVEREAERAVDGAAPALDVSDPAPAAAAPALDVSDPTLVTADLAGDDGMALRLVASAVAAVLGVALLLSPELGSRGLTAAGSSSASDALQDPTSSQAGDADRDGGTTPQAATPAPRAGAAVSGTDLRGLALPEADLLPTRDEDEGDSSDTDPADVGELVPLPQVDPDIDSLTSVTPSLPAPEQDDTTTEGDDDRATQDDATAEADDDTAGPDDGGDDTASDEPEKDDGPRSSQGGSADDDGTAAGTDTDDGSTGGDQTDPTSGEQPTGAGGEEPSGGELDLGETAGEPTSLEG